MSTRNKVLAVILAICAAGLTIMLTLTYGTTCGIGCLGICSAVYSYTLLVEGGDDTWIRRS